jgi:hypothetical protein
MHIPVVPVIGEEIRIGREVYRTGLCRPVKDLQKMVNYYASAETEIVALQPKAPFLGTKKMFQDRYDLWDTANTENHPFLEYAPDPQAAGPEAGAHQAAGGVGSDPAGRDQRRERHEGGAGDLRQQPRRQVQRAIRRRYQGARPAG